MTVAIVTGAARGIGHATVEKLAKDGWDVVAVDLCADDPHVGYPLATRAELFALADAWPNVRGVIADVRDADALTGAVHVALDEFGRIDAAIAAAAIIAGGQPLWETEDKDWDALFDIGVRGVANLARAVIPAMLTSEEPRHGRFVALASAAGHRGLWRLAAYNAAKHAVVGLVRGLATDLRGTGITAVAVSPGSTDTPMLAASADLYGLEGIGEFAQHQLIDRILHPAEIAEVIAFLCSPSASSITGTVVHTDGGFTA
ncbi:SDR family mycofactocin-dependent oxidoreductase [Amycolatopsis xylanica]|uniref:SDR family mycofactocin-dependent oxidoreductase n=1 Tax=Amycolatopsis xylanica TaxID=589385 RepID=A0A1H3A3J2_9PSEU|nr:mycofactocin-coupled SDR family oxidoreductase [Amycolatopsis xylanica]SDX24312.1 SDR family mycofactocin-dependent oxidoreductase [Amycolatopsis xylanica]